MKEKILISACLLGQPCRYDGRSVPCLDATLLSDKFELIPFCPEVEGGLPTPRVPSERRGELVINKEGLDVTEYFNKGASLALKLCLDRGIRIAVLKENSPSCGSGFIYDGSFEGRLKEGRGVTAELLLNNGVDVFSEKNIKEIISRD